MEDDTVFRVTSRLAALYLIITLVGCAAWSEERERHYLWLYEKCIRGEHEPYTIHMNPNDDSAHAQRCREEYDHYVGEGKKA